MSELVSSDLPGLEHEVSWLLAVVRVDADKLLVERFRRRRLCGLLRLLGLVTGRLLEGAAVAPVLRHFRYWLESVVRGPLHVPLGVSFREPANLAAQFSSEPARLVVLARVDHDDVSGAE